MESKTKSGEMIGIIAVAAIILGVVMAFVGPSSCAMRAWNASQGYSQQNTAPATGSSVVGGPSLSAAQINAILTNAGSPAAGTGQDLYNLGVQYGVDPAYPLAFFWNESNFGENGVAAQTHSLGNIRCTDGYACIGGFRAYASWADSYRDWYELISGPYYVKAGLSTPETIIPKYAPSQDHNSPTHYISVVNSCVNLWRTGSTGVPA